MSFNDEQQRHLRNEEQEEAPDVEGHRRMRNDEATEDDTPDVEGHRRHIPRSDEEQDDTPDVEGHARKA